jgi:hypothetical protein
MKRAFLLAAALLVATAAPARADDASVVAAYDARQTTDLPAAGRQYLRGRKRYERSGSDRAARAIIANRNAAARS